LETTSFFTNIDGILTKDIGLVQLLPLCQLNLRK